MAQKDKVSYSELKAIISAHVNGYRKKIRPEVPKSLTVNGLYFTWSDVYNKFYDPNRRESHTDSRMVLVLLSQGIDPESATYNLNW